MTTVTNTVALRGDPNAIFDLVTTAKYWTRWHPATVGVSGQIENPMRLGDAIRERARIGPSLGENDWTVTEWERNKRVVLTMPGTRLGDLKITYTFAPLADGLAYSRELEYDASGLPVELQAGIARQMETDSQTAVERIKKLVEK